MTDSTPGQETILLVENEVLVRVALAEYLRECGYRVVEAASAAEALTFMQSSDLRIDVLFAGVNLSGAMNGFELARWTRTNRPEIKIELTGSIPQAAGVAGDLCQEGPTGVRPYEPSVVAERIRRFLAAKR